MIDRARIAHEPLPVCSEICARQARELGRRRTSIEDRESEPKRHRRRILTEFSGEGIREIIEDPEWELKNAEEVSRNRAAAREWMV